MLANGLLHAEQLLTKGRFSLLCKCCCVAMMLCVVVHNCIDKLSDTLSLSGINVMKTHTIVSTITNAWYIFFYSNRYLSLIDTVKINIDSYYT